MPSPGLVPLQPVRATNSLTSGRDCRFTGSWRSLSGKRIREASSNWPVKSSRWNRVVVFVASERQLGCISCHDPHRLPAPAGKAAFYRRRCLDCHDKKGCALPLAERQSRGPGEDCIACHMPRPDVANIPHMAETDHRIPRGVPGPVPRWPAGRLGLPGELIPRNYHWALMTEEERRDAARDLGVALGSAGPKPESSPPVARVAATQGLPLLEEAVRDRSGRPDRPRIPRIRVGDFGPPPGVTPCLRRGPPH